MRTRKLFILAAGILLLASSLTVQSATIRMAGCSWVTYSQVTASNMVVDSTSTLGGTGTIHAATVVQGDLAPGYGTNVGVLAFTDDLVFNGGTLGCYAAATNALSRISVSGDVTGTGTVVMTRATGVEPVEQVVIAGAASSVYSELVPSPVTEWYLGESGTLDLWVTAISDPAQPQGTVFKFR